MLDCSETKSGINKNNIKYKEKWPIWHIGCKSFKNNINFEEQIVEHTSCENYYAYIEAITSKSGLLFPHPPSALFFQNFNQHPTILYMVLIYQVFFFCSFSPINQKFTRSVFSHLVNFKAPWIVPYTLKCLIKIC